jgi:hypothetical protein
VPLLVSAGHTVAGMTHSHEKVPDLVALGAEPALCDVDDADALRDGVVAFGPDAVMHQLTDLPDDAAEIAEYGERNDRLRRRERTTCWPPRQRPGSSSWSSRHRIVTGCDGACRNLQQPAGHGASSARW